MTPTQYIAAAPEEKQAALTTLDKLIKRCAPTFEPFVMGSMLGYGKYHYRYDSGHEGDSCRIGLAANKGGFSLYICAADKKGYLPEQSKATLGKVNVGKSCIRFKKLDDLNLPALESLVEKAHAMKAPGETDSAPVKAKSKSSAKSSAKTKPKAKAKSRAKAKAKAKASTKTKAKKKVRK